jgi:hypothetical protein
MQHEEQEQVASQILAMVLVVVLVLMVVVLEGSVDYNHCLSINTKHIVPRTEHTI